MTPNKMSSSGIKYIRGRYLRALHAAPAKTPLLAEKEFVAIISHPSIGEDRHLSMSYIPAFDIGNKVEKSFYIGTTHITQGIWAFVSRIRQVNIEIPTFPSQFQYPGYPVESIEVKWAIEFCDRLTQVTGQKFRIPTVQEWTYAATGGVEVGKDGSEVPLNFTCGPQLPKNLANYQSSGPLQVGRYAPSNQFGLFDIHGNASDLCAKQGTYVSKGGGWSHRAADCQIRSELSCGPSPAIGLRVLQEPSVDFSDIPSSKDR